MTIRGRESFDVLIRGGRVVDGTGNPWFHAYEKFGTVREKHRTTAPK
jgi:N-acyl-D-aspartate/D-glutamate deacylase